MLVDYKIWETMQVHLESLQQKQLIGGMEEFWNKVPRIHQGGEGYKIVTNLDLLCTEVIIAHR